MKLKSTLLLSASLLIGMQSFAQLHVSTGTKRYSLLEEGTGTWCGYCPDGAEDIERNILCSTCNPRAIVASFHNGDGLALVPDDFNAQFISGWPGATIDRTSFGGSVTQSRPWESYMSMDTGVAPNFQVDMKSTYDTTTRILTVTVTGKVLSTTALTGSWRINAFITEDSISGATYPQGNYAHCGCSHDYVKTACPQNDTSWYWHDGNGLAETAIPAAHYAHMNVVRAVLAKGGGALPIYGDTVAAFVNPATGKTASKTYIDTLPAGWNAKYVKVIGLVQKYGSSNSDRPIENAIQARLRLMPKNALSVQQNPNTMMEVEIYPNPAKNYITVRGILENPSDTRIVIYNSIGQVIADKEYKSGGSMFGENIQLNNVSSGTYFMRIVNNGESVTKQFVVKQ